MNIENRSRFTPEYIDYLADQADPARLWADMNEAVTLTIAEQDALDTGLVLRHYARICRQMLLQT